MKLGHCYLAPFFNADADICGQRAAVWNLWVCAALRFGSSPYTQSILVRREKYTTCLLLAERTCRTTMLKDKKTKVKITFLVIVVGISSMLAAVVTDHWAVLSPRVEKLNTTCEAAHFGLWRLCKKSIFIVDEDPQGKGCGPISLPGGKGGAFSIHGTPELILVID